MRPVFCLKSSAGLDTIQIPIPVRHPAFIANKLLADWGSYETTIRAARETCSANWERAREKRKADPTTAEMVEHGVREYFASSNLDDAWGLSYWGHVCRKLSAAIKAGVRIRDNDQELQAPRLVVVKLRK